MRQKDVNNLNYYSGSRWFMGTVAMSLVCLLLAWLFVAVLEVEELAEKTMVEMTVRNMQTGLRVSMGEAMIAGRDREIPTWAGSNPVRWLGGPPKDISMEQIAPWTASNTAGLPIGYEGECSAREAMELPAGAWCFDRDRRELVYHPRRNRHLRFLDLNAEGGEMLLRWRVSSPSIAIQQAGGFMSPRVEIVTPYSWLQE